MLRLIICMIVKRGIVLLMLTVAGLVSQAQNDGTTPLTIIVDDTYSFGHTSPSAGTYYYDEGDIQDILFLPDSGYYCKGYLKTWIQDGVERSTVVAGIETKRVVVVR